MNTNSRDEYINLTFYDLTILCYSDHPLMMNFLDLIDLSCKLAQDINNEFDFFFCFLSFPCKETTFNF